ncbi:hypothetical protein ACWDXD_24670 [Streptomyces sp. NPDC003314]
MSEQTTGHPVSIEIRTPSPIPVTALHTLTDAVQGLADQLNAGPLLFGQHLRHDGTNFLFSFTCRITESAAEGDPQPETDPRTEGVHL